MKDETIWILVFFMFVTIIININRNNEPTENQKAQAALSNKKVKLPPYLDYKDLSKKDIDSLKQGKTIKKNFYSNPIMKGWFPVVKMTKKDSIATLVMSQNDNSIKTVNKKLVSQHNKIVSILWSLIAVAVLGVIGYICFKINTKEKVKKMSLFALISTGLLIAAYYLVKYLSTLVVFWFGIGPNMTVLVNFVFIFLFIFLLFLSSAYIGENYLRIYDLFDLALDLVLLTGLFTLMSFHLTTNSILFWSSIVTYFIVFMIGVRIRKLTLK